MLNKIIIKYAIIVITMAGVVPIRAQVTINQQLDMVFRNPSANDYTNKTFAKLSNFDFLRLRLFFDAVISTDKVLFSQILINDNRFILFGAYMRFTNIYGNDLNLNIGLIPNTVGSFGPRTYSNKNPLIGTPLVYNYHTALSLASSLENIQDLLELRGQGYKYYGLPILYDFCWNSGLELYGSLGNLFWSIGFLSGSVSAPSISLKKDRPQITGRLGYYITPEFKLNISGFRGPYIFQYPQREKALDVNNYLNSGIGISLHYLGSYMDIHSEIFTTQWEQPYYETLNASSGYVEFKYKFSPKWYLAMRGESMWFSKVNFGQELGSKNWDFPLDRYEIGLGYHIDRKILIKIVIQSTRSSQAPKQLNDTIKAIQLSTSI